MNQTIDFIVESVQGPCVPNQLSAVDAKVRHSVTYTALSEVFAQVIDVAARILTWTNPEIESRGIDKDDPALADTRVCHCGVEDGIS